MARWTLSHARQKALGFNLKANAVINKPSFTGAHKHTHKRPAGFGWTDDRILIEAHDGCHVPIARIAAGDDPFDMTSCGQLPYFSMGVLRYKYSQQNGSNQRTHRLMSAMMATDPDKGYCCNAHRRWYRKNELFICTVRCTVRGTVIYMPSLSLLTVRTFLGFGCRCLLLACSASRDTRWRC